MLGLFGTSIPLRWLAGTQMVGLALAIMAFSAVSQGVAILLLMAAAVGAFLYSGILGLYSAIVGSFNPRFRSTGVGFVMGCGRAGGAITPALADRKSTRLNSSHSCASRMPYSA